MKGLICGHGKTCPVASAVTVELGGATLVVKGVPAGICDNCGEAYVDEEIARQRPSTADEAQKAGVQVDVREFVATIS
jgi:YgiT-type zinc finger domain-containing protein